jgi:hypothetical protein
VTPDPGEVPITIRRDPPPPSTDRQAHPAFQVLYDLYRGMGCPAVVDPVDPEDCAGVADESVRALLLAGLLAGDSWSALMLHLDGHYPADVFGGADLADEVDVDPGVRIVRLVRALDRLRQLEAAARACVARVRELGYTPGNAWFTDETHAIVAAVDALPERQEGQR